jgi:very-short-patch-repair endonuclease/predicted transcriptional regulator of viral defense system
MADIDRQLAVIAAQQRMLITLDDVYRAGATRDHVAARLASGRWHHVDHRTYLIAGAPLDWHTRQLAAVLAAGRGAVCSHLAAARLWGLPGFGTAGVEVSIPRGRRYRRVGVRSHESTDLDRCHIVHREGIPVTDADRTLLDLARYIGVQRLARTVEAARRADLVTWSSLIAMLAAHARRGRHGTRRTRAVILQGAHRSDVTDTDHELLVLGLLRDAGLPEPVLHHRIYDGTRFVAEVDLAFPQWRIAIECDGDVHLLPEVRERDLQRQNDLMLLGWTVLRFTWERARSRPERIVDEVRAAIRARR